MSDRLGSEGNLRSSLLKSRIAKLPHLPAIAPSQWSTSAEGGAQEETDDVGALGMAPPPRSSVQRNAESRSLDALYSPLSADDCFQEALEVDIGDVEDANIATFRIYYTPPKQASLRKTSTNDHDANASETLDSLSLPNTVESHDSDDLADAGTVFFFHHGAGYSALSYALVAKEITEMTKGEAGVLAFDCRGHGKTKHTRDSESEALSLQNLTDDCIAVLAKVFPSSKPQPTLILVGHSMGGSVVVSLCHALSAAASSGRVVPRVAGVAVLDVVEGSAMAALSSMSSIVSSLPKGFDSTEEAIRWHVDSGTIVNSESARRSVPSLLIKRQEAIVEEGSSDHDDNIRIEADDAVEELISTSPTTTSQPSETYKYIWRANLLATEPYWTEWFQGLSQSFLSVKCARLLLLAGTDRLDKDLMIGQMQGKYQLVVFADVGHSLQEDAPQRTAQTLYDFWKRNESLDIASFKGGLRKVGQP